MTPEQAAALGWRVIWIVRNQKGKLVPQTGSTGYDGQDLPRPSNAVTWAIGCPDGVMMLDADHYGDKTGGDTLDDLCDELGGLPITVKITSRGIDDYGGKYPFRVPHGTILHGSAGKDVDIIQRHHRWTWAPGTIHPKTGTQVQCLGHDQDLMPVDLPAVADLRDLPQPWLEYLSVDGDAGEQTEVDVPDDGTTICEAISSWFESKNFAGATAQGERAFSAVVFLKNKANEGHYGVNQLKGQILAALPETSDKDWDAMWGRAPVFQSYEDPNLICCGRGLFGLEPPAPSTASPNGNTAAGPQEPPRRFTRVKASALSPVAVPWLWKPYLVRGALNLLAGYEGMGKSIIAARIIAQVTRGAWGRPPCVALVVATEDDWRSTILPRLMAADADLDMVEILTVPEGAAELTFPQDCLILEAEIREAGAELVVLDPLLSRIWDKYDTHKDAEVRLALEPLKKVLERTGCAALGLMHWSKNTSAHNPLDRLMGSRAFSAVTRSTLVVAPHPDDPDVKVLAHAKTNVGTMGVAMTFEIKSWFVFDYASGDYLRDDDGQAASAGQARFLDRLEEFSLEAAFEGPKPRKPGAAELAAMFVRITLEKHGGAYRTTDMLKEAVKAGHTSRTMKEADVKVLADAEVIQIPGEPHTHAWRRTGMDVAMVMRALDEDRTASLARVDLIPVCVVSDPAESNGKEGVPSPAVVSPHTHTEKSTTRANTGGQLTDDQDALLRHLRGECSCKAGTPCPYEIKRKNHV